VIMSTSSESAGTSRLPFSPSLTLFNTGWDYQLISGWTDALDGCPDMTAGRRDYLKEQLGLLTRNPDAYVTGTGNLRTRRPQQL
jgi:hypothetical protein